MGLYSCMREHGYNVLCLGQHLDDFAESLLMSAFHNGALRTMKANYFVEAHDLRVARPLVYVRHRVKLVLSQQEFEHPNLFWSLLKCMKPLISINHTERTLRGTGIIGDDAAEEEDDANIRQLAQILAPVDVSTET